MLALSLVNPLKIFSVLKNGDRMRYYRNEENMRAYYLEEMKKCSENLKVEFGFVFNSEKIIGESPLPVLTLIPEKDCSIGICLNEDVVFTNSNGETRLKLESITRSRNDYEIVQVLLAYSKALKTGIPILQSEGKQSL